MSSNERIDSLLRPLNTSDGRDVIELEYREHRDRVQQWDVKCEGCNLKKQFRVQRTERLLRPLNTLEGRNVIELEENEC